jgi:flagellar hook-length control protein FliK
VQTAICCVLWERAMTSKMLGAATFFLAFQLLAAASAPAQGPQPPTPPAAPPPISGIARNVVTWFHNVTRTGTHRHRIMSSPPLPRPAQLTKTPELPAAAVEPNEARPPSTAVEPNNISPAPALTVEPDKAAAELPAAAVEPNEAPPSAAADEPNVGSAGRANTAAEPDRPPRNLPAAGGASACVQPQSNGQSSRRESNPGRKMIVANC